MKKLLTLLALTVLTGTLTAQDFQLQSAKSTCVVAGTSTLHDWTMDAEQMSGKASLTLTDGQVTGISKLTFQVKVESLKSHKSGMDKNAYKAMKSDQYPTIDYELARIISIADKDGGQLIKTGGKLTIAGVTKSVYLDVVAKNSGTVSFEGSTTFKMSDYGVEPPTALMGSIKTGDEITITFKSTYSK